MPKTIVTKFCTLVQSFYLRTTLWNMETTSKLWELNYKVKSLEKVSFLCYQDAPNYSWEEKGEGDVRKKTYLIYSKEVMHQNRMFKPISAHICTFEPSWHQKIYTSRLVLIQQSHADQKTKINDTRKKIFHLYIIHRPKKYTIMQDRKYPQYTNERKIVLTQYINGWRR